MARHLFPPDLFLYEGSNNAVVLGALASFRVWSARTGGTDYTASMLQSDGGSPLATDGSGNILADTDGIRPWMAGPDTTGGQEVNVIYIDAGGGDRYPVYASDVVSSVLAGGAVGDVGAQLDAVLDGVFYAELYAGATDDAKAQAALTACYAAGGGTVVLPAGTLTWTTAALQLLPNGIPVKVKGSKEGTKVTLTSGCPRFADLVRSADGNTFSDIAVEDLLLDGNNIGGKHHVIVGNIIGFSAVPAQRVNISRCSVRRVRAINVLVGTDYNTDLRVGVGFICFNNGDTPDAVNTITDVLIEDVHVEGGISGFLVSGHPLGGGTVLANVFLDRIQVDRCSHIRPVPTAFDASNHVIIGNKGYGNIATIRDFRGKGCGDCGIEVNAIQNFVGENIYVEDAWNHAYYNQNYHAPSNVAAQLHRYLNCTAVRTSAMTNALSNGVDYASKTASGNYSSNVDIIGFRWVDTATTFSGGTDGDALMLRGPGRMTVRDFEGYRDWGTYASGATVQNVMVYADSLDLSQTSRVVLDDVRCRIVGVKSSGSVLSFGLRVGRQGNVDFRLVNIDTDFAVTSAIAYGMSLGDGGSTSIIRGTVDKFSIATSGSSSTSGIRIHGTALTTIAGAITITDPDFSRMGSSATELDYQGASNAAKVHVIRPRWKTARTPSAITVGASPYSYTNLDGYTERVIVRGGTVSAVDLAADGTNFEATGITAGVFLVEPGAVLKVTYSVAPTMRAIPPNATGAA